jgi:hypothetical protein
MIKWLEDDSQPLSFALYIALVECPRTQIASVKNAPDKLTAQLARAGGASGDDRTLAGRLVVAPRVQEGATALLVDAMGIRIPSHSSHDGVAQEQ